MKNPYETEDVAELQEIASYWMQRANNEYEDKLAVIEFITDKGWQMTMHDLIRYRNKIAKSESEKYLEKEKI
jgi:hypothetical protein